MNVLRPTASRVCLCGANTFSKWKTLDRTKLQYAPGYTILRLFTSSSLSSWQDHSNLPTSTYLKPRRKHATKPTLQHHIILRQHATSSRIVTRYEDVPVWYNDEVGLPYRATPLSEKEAASIFGPGVGSGNANRILRILHGRRAAGTLADPSLHMPISEYDKRIEAIALTWLRSNLPMDEDHAAGKRAEVELQAMEAEILADSERLGFYKPDSGEHLPNEMHGHQSIYGKSGIDAIREANQRKFDAQDRAEEEARRKQANEIRENTGMELTQPVGSRIELRRAGENPRLKYYLERAAKVVPEVPPEMSAWQRLWPSGLVVLSLVGGSLAFTQVYTAPSHGGRLWPDMPPAAATVISLIVANSTVFVAWRFPPAFRLLNKYFLSVPGYPRAMSMIGNVFSHQSKKHLLVNMVVLWFVGTQLHDDIGRANFLALYISSGAISSFASLASFTARKVFITSSLGASGAIAGVIASYLWLHGYEHFKLLGLPPDPMQGVPGLGILSFIILMDLIGFNRGVKVGTRFDHVSHLAGYASGIIGGELIRRSASKKRRLEKDKMRNMSTTERIKTWR